MTLWNIYSVSWTLSSVSRRRIRQVQDHTVIMWAVRPPPPCLTRSQCCVYLSMTPQKVASTHLPLAWLWNGMSPATMERRSHRTLLNWESSSSAWAPAPAMCYRTYSLTVNTGMYTHTHTHTHIVTPPFFPLDHIHLVIYISTSEIWENSVN